MAYETLGTYRIHEYEQEEIKELQHITHEDGSITEEEVLVQSHFHTWVDVVVEQDLKPEDNESIIKATMRAYATSNSNDFILTRKYVSASSNRLEIYCGDKDGVNQRYYNKEYESSISSKNISAGDTASLLLDQMYSDEAKNSNSNKLHIYHNFHDGKAENIGFYIKVRYGVENIIGIDNDIAFPDTDRYKTIRNIELIPNDKSTKILTASDFTDETNPTLTYSVLPAMETSSFGLNYPEYSSEALDGYAYYNEEVSVQVGLSLDGVTMDIPYRDISIDNAEYTFELTEDEREYLRSKVTDSSTVPIYYITKTTRILHKNRDGTDDPKFPPVSQDFYNTVERNFSIIGVYPQLNPTVKDILPETLALTGDENTFVRYESMAEYAINALPSKYATIVNQYVQCGSKKIENLPYGVIDDVESGDFNFYVLDSRGMQAVSGVFKNLVEYVKPTCYQKLEIDIAGETGAQINLTMSGNYFNGSFGAADNEYKFEVRYTDDNGDMGEWITLNATPTFKGNTYELKASFTGFNYGKAYVFQSRITDKLNVVQSSQYTVQILPVFDWGAKDFNFNVPVNINAETLDMNGKTIIRHNTTANNTVLSAPNGNIYLRPKGTDETDGQVIIYGNGSTEFSGDVNVAGDFTINGNGFADQIVEIGTNTMGSNGTWYWCKWASGKSECWGCRNFGNMAVTTAWGGLYRSEFLTQDLPEDVFKTTPDVININIVNSNFGGWICKHENLAPSAITTGSFIFVRPASATVSPTYIGFHVIGLWK